MKKLFIYSLLASFFFITQVNAKENLFVQAKSKYDNKKLEDLKIFIPKKYCF